jgi:hypothetical protein
MAPDLVFQEIPIIQHLSITTKIGEGNHRILRDSLSALVSSLICLSSVLYCIVSQLTTLRFVGCCGA